MPQFALARPSIPDRHSRGVTGRASKIPTAIQLGPAHAFSVQSLLKLQDDTIRVDEVHWFEAHGIGKKKMRIKRFLD
jgi:hypothetical protein